MVVGGTMIVYVWDADAGVTVVAVATVKSVSARNAVMVAEIANGRGAMCAELCGECDGARGLGVCRRRANRL